MPLSSKIPTKYSWATVLAFICTACCLSANASAQSARYFQIKVVDSETGRGVPLVKFETVNNRRYYSDSNGMIAFDEPELLDKQVYFHISSHGYMIDADGFGYRGVRLHTKPGSSVEVKIQRVNIAERLYRITGQGIYRDSKRLGHRLPDGLSHDQNNVLGSDSVLAAEIDSKIYWFWGDTNYARYPLGNFHVPGAISKMPDNGGLDPDTGISLDYFLNEKGLPAETCKMPGQGPTWLDCVTKLYDTDGSIRLFGVYMKVKAPLTIYEQGIIEFNFDSNRWEHTLTFPNSGTIIPRGHSFRHTDGDTEYVYFGGAMPWVRVPATIPEFLDPSKYETYTPLRRSTGSGDLKIARSGSGTIAYEWRRDTPRFDMKSVSQLIQSKELSKEEAPGFLVDIATGKQIQTHHGSVYFNMHRRRFIMITTESFGTSALGEIWFAEAEQPEGPWKYATKVITHDKYSFYNPKHHPMFDQRNGRTIYLEGTYTTTFSGNNVKTPGYDYNQIMYKLNLEDARLNLPVPVYMAEARGSGSYWKLGPLRPDQRGQLRFFALDRPKQGSREITVGNETMHVMKEPARDKQCPTIALWNWTNEMGDSVWRLETEKGPNGYTKGDSPVGYVWE